MPDTKKELETLKKEYDHLKNKENENIWNKMYLIFKDLVLYNSVLTGNYLELQEIAQEYETTLEEYNQDSSEYLRKKIGGIPLEFMRLLHNFILSAFSWIENVRGQRNHLEKHYSNPISLEEYNQKKKELNLGKNHQFLKTLRNQFSHKLEKSAFSQVDFFPSLSNDGVNQPIIFKEIKKQVMVVVQEFYSGLQNFYTWFTGQLVVKYADERLEAVNISYRLKKIEKQFECKKY
ncbi:MAG: hypothetical protein ACFE9L_11315 [Candidatus Hodarchaeota archaeon]